jgi:hypothetical protein
MPPPPVPPPYFDCRNSIPDPNNGSMCGLNCAQQVGKKLPANQGQATGFCGTCCGVAFPMGSQTCTDACVAIVVAKLLVGPSTTPAPTPTIPGPSPSPSP